MSFLKKMFGSKDPYEELQQQYDRKEWVALQHAAKRINREDLSSEQREELSTWEEAAGDALATINIDEGTWAQRSGNLVRAREDFQLAIEQARSADLKQRAADALAALEKGELVPETSAEDSSPEVAADGPALHVGCDTGCGPSGGDASVMSSEATDLDEEAHMELLLASLPEELADRYADKGESFRRAWMAVQEGDDERALELYAEVPEEDRDGLYLAEVGGILSRKGDLKKAVAHLQQAVAAEPDLFPAFETLVVTLFSARQGDVLMKLLKEKISEETFVPFSWNWIARIHARRGEGEPALAAGMKALDEGSKDPALVTMCAQILEQKEQLGEAEQMLQRLPAGGCGGGANPMLGEFWLRHGMNLNAALESFKGALRQERDNPRWPLRIAQVYLEKGWRNEASEQLDRLMARGGLPDEIADEVRTTLDRLKQ